MRCALREPSFGTSNLRSDLAFGFADLLRQALSSFGNMLAHQPFRPIAVSFFDGVDNLRVFLDAAATLLAFGRDALEPNPPLAFK
jgi:hypothetical protein